VTIKGKGIKHIGTLRIIPYEAGKMIPEVTGQSYLSIDVYRTELNVILELSDLHEKETFATITLDDDLAYKLRTILRKAIRNV